MEYSELLELRGHIDVLSETVVEHNELLRSISSTACQCDTSQVLSASVCSLAVTSVLDWRRDAETWQSAVDELKGSTLTITQRIRQFVAAVSVLNESSQLLDLRGNAKGTIIH